MRPKVRDIFPILLMATLGLLALGCTQGKLALSLASLSTPTETPLPTSTPTATLTLTPTATSTPTPTPAPIELTILHTNNTRGYTEPCG